MSRICSMNSLIDLKLMDLKPVDLKETDANYGREGCVGHFHHNQVSLVIFARTKAYIFNGGIVDFRSCCHNGLFEKLALRG